MTPALQWCAEKAAQREAWAKESEPIMTADSEVVRSADVIEHMRGFPLKEGSRCQTKVLSAVFPVWIYS